MINFKKLKLKTNLLIKKHKIFKTFNYSFNRISKNYQKIIKYAAKYYQNYLRKIQIKEYNLVIFMKNIF